MCEAILPIPHTLSSSGAYLNAGTGNFQDYELSVRQTCIRVIGKEQAELGISRGRWRLKLSTSLR
jgi:hypothetical protein